MLRHLLGNLAEGVLTLHWWEAALTTFQLRPEAVNQLFCDNGLPVRVHRAHVGHVRLALEGGQISLVVERVFAIVALSDVPPPPSEGDRPVIEASASAEPPSTPSPDHAPQGRLPGLMARGVERLVLAVARRVQLRISAVHVRIDGADGVSASLTLRELTLRDQSSPDVAAAMGLAIALQVIGAAATVTTKAAVPPVSAPATVPASAIASAMNAAPCLVPERRAPLTCDASLLRDAAAWEAAMLDSVGRPLCSDHLLAPLSLRMELGVRLGDVPLEGYWLESTLDLGMGDPIRFRLVDPQVRTQIQHKRLALPPPSPRLTSARWHRIASIDRVHLPTCQLDALGMLLAPLLNALPPAEPPESAISPSPLPPSSVLLAERLSQLRQLAAAAPKADDERLNAGHGDDDASDAVTRARGRFTVAPVQLVLVGQEITARGTSADDATDGPAGDVSVGAHSETASSVAPPLLTIALDELSMGVSCTQTQSGLSLRATVDEVAISLSDLGATSVLPPPSPPPLYPQLWLRLRSISADVDLMASGEIELAARLMSIDMDACLALSSAPTRRQTTTRRQPPSSKPMSSDQQWPKRAWQVARSPSACHVCEPSPRSREPFTPNRERFPCTRPRVVDTSWLVFTIPGLDHSSNTLSAHPSCLHSQIQHSSSARVDAINAPLTWRRVAVLRTPLLDTGVDVNALSSPLDGDRGPAAAQAPAAVPARSDLVKVFIVIRASPAAGKDAILSPTAYRLPSCHP